MSFARMHKIVAYLIAGLGLFALGIGDELSGGAQLAIALAYTASFFAEGAILSDKRWIHGWTVLVIAFFFLQIVRGIAGESYLSLAVEFAAGFQISRLFNRRTAREHQQIAALALLHLMAATVLSSELSYAFVFLAFVVAAPWMLALSHLRLEIEGQFGSRPEAEKSLARVLASKRLIGARYLAGTASLGVPLFMMTGLLFVMFPRVGLGILSFGQENGQNVSGFGANVELGEFGTIRLDPTVVMRVRPPDLPRSPPRLVALRMRGTSFDRYDGRRWTRSRDLRSQDIGRIGSMYAVPVRLPYPSRDRAWDIVLDPLEEPVVFLPPGTVGIEIAPRVTGGNEVGRQVNFIPNVEVRYADADGLGLRYRAWVSDEEFRYYPDDLHRYLQMPEHHERVARLARRWTEGATSDEQRVAMLIGHLRESGEYSYSLEMPRVGDRVALDVFLFDVRAGHCEYFATALAVMLRSLGIPARNVTGFLGGRYNEYGGYYALSQGDAHSWVEAWMPERGWVTLDPTPAMRDAMGPDDGLFADVRDLVDAMRTRWTRDIVGYDLRRQVSLFRRIARWVRPSPTEAREERDEQGAVSSRMPGLWWIFPIAALAIVVAVAVRRLRKRRPPPLDPAVREVVGLYRSLDRALARLGHSRPPARTPREHLAHLQALGFGASALVREITERYVAARYGGERLDPAELARLGREIAALAKRRDLFAKAQ